MNGLVLAPAVLVDRPGQQFFAGSGLAADQHRGVSLRPPGTRFPEHGPARATGPMMLSNPYFSSRALRRIAHLLDQPLVLERAVHDEDQLLVVDRLGDVVVGARLHGLDGRLHRAEGRDHHDGRLRMLGTDLLEQFHPGDFRHLQVGDDQGRRLLLQQCAIASAARRTP